MNEPKGDVDKLFATCETKEETFILYRLMVRAGLFNIEEAKRAAQDLGIDPFDAYRVHIP